MDVNKTADLANLPLSDEESKLYEPQLNNILGYVDQLQKTDTSEVVGTAQVIDLKNVAREDEVEQAPPLVKGFVKVKAIFANND